MSRILPVALMSLVIVAPSFSQQPAARPPAQKPVAPKAGTPAPAAKSAAAKPNSAALDKLIQAATDARMAEKWTEAPHEW